VPFRSTQDLLGQQAGSVARRALDWRPRGRGCAAAGVEGAGVLHGVSIQLVHLRDGLLFPLGEGASRVLDGLLTDGGQVIEDVECVYRASGRQPTGGRLGVGELGGIASRRFGEHADQPPADLLQATGRGSASRPQLMSPAMQREVVDLVVHLVQQGPGHRRGEEALVGEFLVGAAFDVQAAPTTMRYSSSPPRPGRPFPDAPPVH
jgi:hypothetical protein